MEVVKEYRPLTIDFTIKTKEVPLSLGKFKTEKEARKFIAENTVSLQTDIQAERLMDEYEVDSYRERYSDELEQTLPELRIALFQAESDLEKAKEAVKQAKESKNASLNKIQQLADEVKRGIIDMDLDKSSTYEVSYNGKNYYYTYIDGELKLAKIQDVPSYRIDDLISTSEQNALFFDEQLKAANG
jgi:hypothetical protein